MTDDNLQIELDEETSNQLEAARGLMMYQDDGEVPSNESVIERAIAFYLEEHDVVRGHSRTEVETPSLDTARNRGPLGIGEDYPDTMDRGVPDPEKPFSWQRGGGFYVV